MLLQNTEKPHHWELIRGEASCLFQDYLLLYVQSEISRSNSEITPVVRSSYILFTFYFRFLIALILLLWYNLYIVKKLSRPGGDFVAYNFDFSYLKNGSPIVTLSSFGIAFNKGAIEALGTPEQVIIGFDPEACAIGVRARGENTTSPSYDFARRIKNDWIRIGAKDFVKYLAKVSGIDFLTKAKQFIAEYDPETETLIVVVDEQHLK